MMDVLLELTFSMKHSWNDSPSRLNKNIPSPTTELKILQGVARDLNVVVPDFCKRLTDWADIIRKTFYDGGIEEVISTRRLVHVIRLLHLRR